MDPNAFSIDGQRIVLRERITLKDAPRLPGLIQAYGRTQNADDLVRVLTLVVASWDLDGDPRNPKAYDEFDLYDQLLPMGDKAIRALNARFDAGRRSVEAGAEPQAFLVAGKHFVARRRIPVGMAPRLPSMIDRFGESGDVTDLVRVLALVAESTDLVDGDPNDPRSYQGLDVLTEILPVGEKVIAYLTGKLEYARTKN